MSYLAKKHIPCETDNVPRRLGFDFPSRATFLIWGLGLLGLAYYAGRRRKGVVEIDAVPVRRGMGT